MNGLQADLNSPTLNCKEKSSQTRNTLELRETR